MRRINSKVIILLIILLASTICLASLNIFAADGSWFNYQDNNDAYQYPVTPSVNKDEWASLQSHEEKTDLCQVPEDVLEVISTKGLIETCLTYPLFCDMAFFNSPQSGYDRVADNFNGLQELEVRQNAGAELLALYSNIDLDNLKTTDTYPALRLQYLEMIIAQNSVLQKMSESSRHELLNACIEQGELKQKKYPDVFSLNTTALIIGRILYMDNPDFVIYANENDSIMHFLKTGSIVNSYSGEWDEILINIQEYIKYMD